MSQALLLSYGAAAPFTPASIANLRLWLDASDTATIAHTGGAVSTWTSKDPNARVFTKGGTTVTTGSKTLNGQNVLELAAGYLTSNDAASVWKFMNDGADCTIFVVFRAGTVSDPNDLYGLMGNNLAGSSQSGANLHWEDRASLPVNESVVFAVGNAANSDFRVKQTAQDAFWSPIGWGVLEVFSDLNNGTAGSRCSTLRAGVAATTTPTGGGSVDTAGTPLYALDIGATGNGNRPFTGQIAEVVIYEGQLSSGNRALVRDYLSAKWAIGQPGGVVGAALWLDADDAESFVLSGSNVVLWADKSGRGRNGTQSTSGSRPTRQTNIINSRAVVRFDGTDDIINVLQGLQVFRNVGGATAIAVAKTTDPSGTRRIVHASINGNNNGRVGFVTASSQMIFGVRRLDADASANLQGGTIASDTAQIFLGQVDYTNRPGELFVNAASVASNATLVTAGSTSDTDGNNLNIGAQVAASQHWQGDIAEVILFARALTSTERSAVHTYLANKWGVSI